MGPASPDPTLRDFYDRYPYPPRDPADEAHRLIEGSPSTLTEVDHFLFDGGRTRPDPFRVLVAGCGTGDAVVMIAQQMTDRRIAGTVLGIDLSSAALDIALARLHARGLTNASVSVRSLDELDRHGDQRFDYIDCCGVLHHLPDPSAGMEHLATLLTRTGGIGLMMYGRIARIELDALRRALPDGADPALARAALTALPPSHPVRERFAGPDASDAEIADLLLNPRVRTYAASEVLAVVERAGLSPVDFVEPALYDPASYGPTETGAGDVASRADEAERRNGTITNHVMYAAAAPVKPLTLDGSSVLMLRHVEASALADRNEVTITASSIRLRFTLSEDARALLRELDGRRSLAEIGATDTTVRAGRELVERLVPLGWLLVSHRPQARSNRSYAPALRDLNRPETDRRD